MTTGKNLLLASAAAASLALLASATADAQRRVNDRPLGGPDTFQALKGQGSKGMSKDEAAGTKKYYDDLKRKQEKMKSDASASDNKGPKP